jgi:hypothetical protein
LGGGFVFPEGSFKRTPETMWVGVIREKRTFGVFGGGGGERKK